MYRGLVGQLLRGVRKRDHVVDWQAQLHLNSCHEGQYNQRNSAGEAHWRRAWLLPSDSVIQASLRKYISTYGRKYTISCLVAKFTHVGTLESFVNRVWKYFLTEMSLESYFLGLAGFVYSFHLKYIVCYYNYPDHSDPLDHSPNVHFSFWN